MILSLFPGIGLLDRAFELEGFTIVRGPDILWGGDVKEFHPPAGVFDGIFGGPPCQCFVDYANLNRATGKTVAEDLIPEFLRVVLEARPNWFLIENSPNAYNVAPEGYMVQSLVLNACLFGVPQDRERKFQFGSLSGTRIRPEILPLVPQDLQPACLASEGKAGRIQRKRVNGSPRAIYHPRRSWKLFTSLQGLPETFLEQAPFTVQGKYTVVGNGVPLPMGRAIAKAIKAAL